MQHLFYLILLLNLQSLQAQPASTIRTFRVPDSVRVTIDEPIKIRRNKETIVIFFALPNGNTTEQTMGKKIREGDDWHFDIQHIRAQTDFIRQSVKNKNWVVIYLENDYKSWPGWKQRHADYGTRIPKIIDSLTGIIPGRQKSVYLNGHSGGGSLIFGYISGLAQIPVHVKRISFLDSDYGYDSSYYPKFQHWLKNVNGSSLNVFAYNDSVALYNGKPLVSATGGTWYRSHLFMKHLRIDYSFNNTRSDSIIVYKTPDERIQFYFKTNPDRKIFHTQQVELNGFIHSVLCGTVADSREYKYYGPRAYSSLIRGQ